MQFIAPDDGWKNRLKHVEGLRETNRETSHLVGCTLRINLSVYAETFTERNVLTSIEYILQLLARENILL